MPGPRSTSIAILIALMLVTLAGGWVRVTGLSAFALNPDESINANLSLDVPLVQAWSGSRMEPHPPGQFVILNLIGRISRAPSSLRLLALVPGIALIPLMFLLGRAVRDDTTGLVAAWFTAFGQAGILLSGVVRSYSAAVALITLGLLFFLAARDQPRYRWCAGYAISFSAAVLLHYSAVIPLLATALMSGWAMLRTSPEVSRARRLGGAALVPLSVVATLLALHVPNLWGSELKEYVFIGWLRSYFPRSPSDLISASGDLLSYLFHDSVGHAIVVLTLSGGVMLWRRGGRGRDLVTLALVSYGTAAVLGFLEIYPFGGVRHSFFLLPLAVAPAAASLGGAWTWFRGLPPMQRPHLRVALGIALAALFTFQAASLIAGKESLRTGGHRAHAEFPVPTASLAGIMQFISERIAPDDVILINGQTEVMVRYPGYLELPLSPDSPGLLAGRELLMIPDFFFESEEHLDTLLRELAPGLQARGRARLWLLNIGWRSLDDALPPGGWGRGLLTDGVVMDGAYAGAIPVLALLPDADGASPSYRVLVSRDGVHQLRFEDLGFPGSLPQRLASDRLGVSHRGEALPIWVEDGGDGVFGPGDRIEFIGHHLGGSGSHFDEYSDRNVYWLDTDAHEPLRMSAWEPAERCDDGATVHRRRVHLEEEHQRIRFASRDAEHGRSSWFWARMTPLDPEPTVVHLPLQAIDRSHQVTLRIRLRGWSHLPRKENRVFADHVVELTLDGRSLGRPEWNNTPEGYVFETTLTGITGEAPQLELRVPSRTVGDDPKPRADVVLLDWVDVEYTRFPEAPQAQLRLEPPANGCLAFNEGKDISLALYDDAGKRAVLKPGAERVGWQAQGGVYAVPDGALISPDRVSRDHPSHLRSPDHQADYLMVAHQRLRFAIQPLVELHRKRGLKVEVIDVQDIYDEFNHGVVHPRAIREFFRYTHNSWQRPAPRYALLVGDASFDPRSNTPVQAENYDDRVFLSGAGLVRERAGGYWYSDRNRENHRNLIPTFTYAGSDGQAASDFGFVDFGPEEENPAMAIGRFPVTEPEEVEAIVAKTIRYVEQPEEGSWRRRILWIANDMEYFQKRTDRLADEAAGYSGVRVYPSEGKTNAATREELLHALDEGQLLVHFLGHGGRFIWQTGRPDLSDDRDLFTLDDVDRIRPGGRLPIVLSMTCYSAPFDHPNADSIGEKLLRVPDRGAVAVVAASWRISPTYEMSRLLTEEFTRPGTVGEAVARAKRRSASRQFIHLFNLLGDPATPIAIANDAMGGS